jgi:pimeloyl-ACP methyl ester carboxylesterase
VAAGDRDEAVRRVMRGLVGLTEVEVAALAADEGAWAPMIRTVGRLPRELRAVGGHRFGAGRYRRVTQPTLVLEGDLAPGALRAAAQLAAEALPNGRALVLAGVGHEGVTTHPERVAQVVLDFVDEVERYREPVEARRNAPSRSRAASRTPGSDA